MFNYTGDVKIISSYKMKSKPTGIIKNRGYHGFIFRIAGDSQYFFEDKTVNVKPGELIFLPKGSSYEWRVSNGEGLYTSINFTATFNDPCVAVYSQELFPGMGRVVQSFSELWNFGSSADKYQCYALFYELLSSISKMEHSGSAEKKKCALIEPAVEYLKKHIHDGELRTEKLHDLCGISDTYFRKIFASRFHMSPREYVSRRRIADARTIIESGDYDNIKEVAATVGYNDPLYFSKAFKNFYGVSPSNLGNE